VELSVISGTPLPAESAARFEVLGVTSFALSKELPPTTIPNRIRWIFDRTLRGKPNSRFGEFVSANRFALLFPLTYDNQYNIGVSLPLGNALGRCRWVGWIPDFQHRILPHLFDGREINKRDTGIAALASDARTIVFSSESAAADFRRFYPDSRAKLEVLHFHTYPTAEWFEGDPAGVQRQFHLPDRFFLVSNQFWQHKNHTTLFEALGLLRARDIFPEVVCTGSPHDFRNKEYFNEILRRLHELGVARQVHLLGLISRQEQVQLMRRSLAVVQPSLFEGWSTVVEDARTLGKTILLSDLDVHREQNPPGAAFFRRSSAEDLADLLAEWWTRGNEGPDLAGEKVARTAAQEASCRYARRFLEITSSAA
jgi:glycosyltransferase involved in cell wall biosynthesis